MNSNWRPRWALKQRKCSPRSWRHPAPRSGRWVDESAQTAARTSGRAAARGDAYPLRWSGRIPAPDRARHADCLRRMWEPMGHSILGIAGAVVHEVVVLGQRGIVAVRGFHQRRAAGPAPDHLERQPHLASASRSDPPSAGLLSSRNCQNADLLTQLAKHHVAAVDAEITSAASAPRRRRAGLRTAERPLRASCP